MKRVLLVSALLAPGCIIGCVARGALVLTPRGLRPIEDLDIDDEVYSVHEDTGELVPTRITAVRQVTREVGLMVVDGQELRLTSDHPVYCPNEDLYAPAGDWFLGKRSSLLCVDEHGTSVVTPERVETFVKVVDVFDITVESELHNFVAQGVLVHNKSPANNNDYPEDENCYVDGRTYWDGATCLCPGARVGEYSCNSEQCVCVDEDMGSPSDMPTVDLGTGEDDLGAPDLGGDMDADLGTPRQRGDCVDDADCAMPNWMCVSVPANEPAGHFTCQADVVAEPGCATIEAPDQCCVHADCTDAPSGTCVIGPLFYCGGAAPVVANICVYDECAADGDCAAGEICMPPRALGEPVSRCLAAECTTDADCSTRAGGECHMFRSPCNGRVSGFFCTYDDSVCRTNDDCSGGEFCGPGPDGDGDTGCAVFQPPP